jgi:UDP-galactopyranose mutase
MLDHPNITLCLNTAAESRLYLSADSILLDGQCFEGPVIYTGALDELFSCQYGRLPYRTLDFQFETLMQDTFQSHGTVPYYAVISSESRACYDQYRLLSSRYSNFYPLGRLAEYQYYNMDAITERALQLCDELLSR